jgi:hypothetical protein
MSAMTRRPGVVHRRRLAAQRLTDPPRADVVDGVGHLLAVQAQDPRGARLALRVRSRGLKASDVDRALTDDRSVVVSWFNRGTLHLVKAEDYWWLHALTTPPLASSSVRRLAQEGVGPADAERGIEIVRSTVAAHGPTSRSDLRERLRSAGVPVVGQAFIHVLFAATLRGYLVRGPVVGGEQAFVAVEDWLGKPPSLPGRDVMLGELAGRYLVAHGPATDRDLAKWSGLTLGDARRGIRALGKRLVETSDGLVDLAGRPPSDHGLPPPLLLGAFDPLLLGWVSRKDVLGDLTGVVLTTNGVFRPFVLVGGRAVCTWGLPDKRVSVADVASLPPRVRTALVAEAEAVESFLGA